MASWGGHTLPGLFFLLYGIYEAFNVSLKKFKKPTIHRERCRMFTCAKAIKEGLVKISLATVGILIELFYPGSPMGRLHDDTGNTYMLEWSFPGEINMVQIILPHLLLGRGPVVNIFCFLKSP